MPPASAKSTMSTAELVTCEEFLEGHRIYAVDLLYNLVHVSRLHANASGIESCPESCLGQTCALCELCSANGLMGATKKALTTYGHADKRLKTVRASLGKSAPSRGTSALRHGTLFNSSLAKAVFNVIAHAGESLRSEHASWQTHLQNALATSTSTSTSVGQHAIDLSRRIADLLLPTYSGPRIETDTKSDAASDSPMFVVLSRCLSADCPCELNKPNLAADAKSRGADGLQASEVALSLTNVKKTRKPKKKPRKTGDTQDSSTCRDSNNLDAQEPEASLKPQDEVQEGHKLSNTTLSTQETESSLLSPECGTPIVDPRIFRLREEISRSDDARRALMAWCRAWTTDLDETELEASATPASTANDPQGRPIALAHDLETVATRKSSCATSGHLGTATRDLSHGNTTTAQELRFDKQRELSRRWQVARQKRCEDQKRRMSGRGRIP